MELNTLKICQLYKDGCTIKSIAKKAKCRQSTISSILKNSGLHVASKNQYRLNYKLNHKYFSKINSVPKAYFLGWMFSDGNVSEQSNRISLVINDLSILKSFKKELGLTRNIYKNPCHDKAFTLDFSSKEMKNDLIKLGCVPRKSLVLKYPKNLLEKYFFHFLRGYFDGDGSIYINTPSGEKAIKLIGSRFIINTFLNKLEQHGIKCGSLLRANPNKKETVYFRITGRSNLILFEKLLYKNCKGFFLERKRCKF